MIVEPNIALVASLIGEPARAAMLVALLDGRSLPASELAFRARVSPQTTSSHLAKLMSGKLLAVETHGRHRYYRIANAEVAQALEAIQSIAPQRRITALLRTDEDKTLRFARTCYDHLAGKLAVELTQKLVERGVLRISGADYSVTRKGAEWLKDFGIEVEEAKQRRRAFARQCLDWSERRHHIAGALGAAILARLFELNWIARQRTGRAVRLTHTGQRELHKEFNIRL